MAVCAICTTIDACCGNNNQTMNDKRNAHLNFTIYHISQSFSSYTSCTTKSCQTSTIYSMSAFLPLWSSFHSVHSNSNPQHYVRGILLYVVLAVQGANMGNLQENSSTFALRTWGKVEMPLKFTHFWSLQSTSNV